MPQYESRSELHLGERIARGWPRESEFKNLPLRHSGVDHFDNRTLDNFRNCQSYGGKRTCATKFQHLAAIHDGVF